MAYACEATSLTGFVQQVATAYLPHGYWFYVSGLVPERKDPRTVDVKLLERYGVGVSKWTRARRKAAGQANVHYIRFERRFALLATHGQHPFFEAEQGSVRDARRVPLKIGGYALSYRKGQDGRSHAHVRIDHERYKEIKAWFLGAATRRPADVLARVFWSVPFEPYAPVRRQLLNILRATNRARQVAGLTPVPVSALRFKRRIVKPFAVAEAVGVANFGCLASTHAA